MRKVAQIYFLRGNWDSNATELVVKDGLSLEVPSDDCLEGITVPPIAGEVQGPRCQSRCIREKSHP